tara:strand:- start:13847 stop:14710 length:864 start_codon:yes stop_codon:yes gene_type:complete
VGVISVIGRGRIVVWEGASLWMIEGGGVAADLTPHTHHAIQITFQLEGSFELGVMDDRLTGPVVAVASDASHTFKADGGGAVAFLFIEPESPAGRALAVEWFAHRTSTNITAGPLVSCLDDLRVCLHNGASAEGIVEIGRKIIGFLPAAELPTLPDPRVLAIIEYARKNLENTVTLPGAAAHVNLSPSRARHLFAAQTGLPFKTYILWRRLELAVALYAGGSSITEAAHNAGFSDSAHFSRTFRRTFGLPAAALRLQHGNQHKLEGVLPLTDQNSIEPIGTRRETNR